MACATRANFRSRVPTDNDSNLARISSRILSSHLSPGNALKLTLEDGKEEVIEIPAEAAKMLLDILIQMAEGNSITLLPMFAELTTQQAADILNVSRPYLVKLLDSGEIAFRKTGTHRRVYLKDILEYKESIDAKRLADLDELASLSQELDMGY